MHLACLICFVNPSLQYCYKENVRFLVFFMIGSKFYALQMKILESIKSRTYQATFKVHIAHSVQSVVACCTGFLDGTKHRCRRLPGLHPRAILSSIDPPPLTAPSFSCVPCALGAVRGTFDVRTFAACLFTHMEVVVIWKRLKQTLHLLGQIPRVTWTLQLDSTVVHSNARRFWRASIERA